MDLLNGAVIKNLPANTGDLRNADLKKKKKKKCRFEPWVRKIPWSRQW